MQVGIGSYTFFWAVTYGRVDAFGLVERARELNVGVVQICDNLPLERLSRDELDRLAAQETIIEVGTRGSLPELLRRYLAIARMLRSPIVRTVLDAAGDEPSIGEAIRRLREVAGEFADAGIALAIENHDRFTARDFLTILDGVDSPALGICLDTTNSFGALEGPDVVIDALAPRAANLHVKDFAIRRFENMLGFTIDGRPAGQGRLDIPRLLGVLLAAGRDVNAIVELWMPPEADVELTLAREAAWAGASVEYLRPVVETALKAAGVSRK